MTADADAEAVTDSAVRGMVDALRPDWRVTGVERSDEGTDFVATLAVRTPDGDRTVVLKATTAGFVDAAVARAEPRLLDLVDRETDVPVPSVVGYCDRHDDYPAPFYLLTHVDGETYENDHGSLSVAARERVLRDAGRNLAALHELGPLPAVGTVGVRDGDLAVLDSDDHPRHEDVRDAVLADCEETLDALADGGFFPERADDPERFADLVCDLREHVRERVPALPDPDPPTYCHWDYRLGNLLVDPETGATRAVLDWANLSATEPAYNLATAEFYLLRPQRDDAAVTRRLRAAFRSAYADARTDWAFTDDRCERIRAYRLACRLGAMACLPLWYEDASPRERDERAAEHRAAVADHLS